MTAINNIPTPKVALEQLVPVTAPKAGYLAHKDELDAAYHVVMDSGWYIQGKSLEAFEVEFAAFCGTTFAVGVATGTDAITIALHAAGVGAGDEVITTPLTAAFTTLAIQRIGATPVFVDIDKRTYCLDPGLIVAALTPKTKAILPVHLYGQPADLDGIREALTAAGREDVLLIEDACQAHGAQIGEARVGSIGLAGTFSFYPTKNLGAFGDGGMIVTGDATLAKTAQMLRDGGQSSKYYHELSGYNSRLDELQAAFLSVRLRHLEADNARRSAIATRYSEALKPLGFLHLPEIARGRTSVWHLYVVRTKYRDALVAHLKLHGVQTGVHYPRSLHHQPFWKNVANPTSLPVTEQVVNEILSLPMYPEMTDAAVEQVVAGVRSFATA